MKNYGRSLSSNLTIVVVWCLLLLLLLLLLEKGRLGCGQDGLTGGGPRGPRGTGGHRRCCRPLMEHVKCPSIPRGANF